MIYSGDVSELSQEDLIQCLKGLAAAWRESPHLSNEYSESLRYRDIQRALEERFGVLTTIQSDMHPTDYQVVFLN